MLRRSVLNLANRSKAIARPGRLVYSAHLRTPSLTCHLKNVRFHSSHSHDDDKSATLKVDNPQMMIAFTCKKCDTRSSHAFSRQSYYKGTVLIQCPGCKNRHLIADNLKIFRDNKVNLEDILREQGKSVATTTADLAFEDIPESLRSVIGHHAKDAPEEYRKNDDSDKVHELPKPKDD